jgi:hypothetical protein
MTHLEAENIIIAYSKAIKTNLRPNAIVQSISELPYSPAKIKYAHLLYAEYLVKENILTKELGDSLISSYASISTIFVEDPESINKRYRNYLKELNQGTILKDFNLSAYTVSPDSETEFNNFLADCQGRWK